MVCMGERDRERRKRQRDNNAEKDSKLADQNTEPQKLKKLATRTAIVLTTRIHTSSTNHRWSRPEMQNSLTGCTRGQCKLRTHKRQNSWLRCAACGAQCPSLLIPNFSSMITVKRCYIHLLPTIIRFYFLMVCSFSPTSNVLGQVFFNYFIIIYSN